MTWPVTDAVTTNMDAGSDSPVAARADILLATQNCNSIKNHVTAFMQTVLDDADATAARATLVAEGTASKDATGGYAGLTLFKINFKNAANTLTNFFTNATTLARTYTFPDKDMTVAGISDINGGTVAGSFTTLTASGTSTLQALNAGATIVTTLTATATNVSTLTASGAVSSGSTLTAPGDVILGKTITAPATTGARTINKTSGSVNFAAAATSLAVTNNLVDTNSVIICTVGTNDATMASALAVAAAGSFTLHANAAATAETRVNFLVVN